MMCALRSDIIDKLKGNKYTTWNTVLNMTRWAR